MNQDGNPGGQIPPPSTAEEAHARVAAIWTSLLGLPRIGMEENFFEVGGTSLLASTLLTRLNRAFGCSLPIAAVFESPTVRAMAEHWRTAVGIPPANRPESATAPIESGCRAAEAPARVGSSPEGSAGNAIAIVAIAGRFPGAATVEAFWENLAAGTESISRFPLEEIENREQASRPGFVAARPILENVELFDAAFFGIYPKEAEQMDPQHRIFLECAWEALERAGYDPAHTEGAVGVFAGCSMNTYFMRNLVEGRRFLEDFTGGYQVGSYVTMMGNDKDFLATRVSYKLNLRGPSITVQTACSTSLVAVSQACESLRAGGCDMAIAGAVSITFPQKRGYLPQEGGLASLDGHCRPFDHRANGTVFGHGAGVVLLKRLEDALAAGDQVLAVIRGWAVNNDGSAKVGYTAPGVDGQATVITRAREMAQVPADSITYLEAHGTGTPLGDPIEIAALTKSFRASTDRTAFCSLGAAKANVGHLDVAAGAAGLIKTVLQMEHRQIPGLLHFEQPNPHLDLDRSPFFVSRRLDAWQAGGFPLRAGVSAFGVGGTNAHVIVEEPPALRRSEESGRRYHLIPWSAKSPAAADAFAARLKRHFAANPGISLADAAFTLQLSRTRRQHRRALVAGSSAEAQAALAGSAPVSGDRPFENPGIVFCFPGQGVQSPGMGAGLFRSEPVFSESLRHCDEILRPLLGESLLNALHPRETNPESERRLNQTVFAQPAIFAFEYALARLWLSWGIRPVAMIGHSVGEYVAATLSGVLSLEDALRAIAARGRLMQSLAPGSMLAVRAPGEVVLGLLPPELDLAAVNSPQLTVVSGESAAVTAFGSELARRQIQSRELLTSHAFHSRMVEPALEPFAKDLEAIRFGRPSIPYVSTVTGRWITAEEASSPAYWTSQIRRPVRFADAAAELLRIPERLYLEVGPQETASQMLRQCALAAGAGQDSARIVPSLAGKPGSARDEEKEILSALGRLWAAGAEPDWPRLHAGTDGEIRRRRILLPTYPFERKPFWISQPPASENAERGAGAPACAMPQLSGAASEITPPTCFPSSAEDPKMTNQPLPGSPASMLDEIKLLVTDLSGTELREVDPGASFLELGFDSLFLTQLTQAVQSKYRVKLTFRQIMESYPTLETLAAYLETVTPVELRAAAPPPVPAPSTAAPVYTPAATGVSPAIQPASGASAGSLQALYAAQMEMMSGLFRQQMELLRAATQQPANSQLSSAALPAASGQPPAGPATSSAVAGASAAAPPPTVSSPAAAKSVYTPFKPLERGAAGGLSAQQESYLREFIARYNRKTPTSKSYTQQYRPVFAGGRVVAGFHALIKEMVYPLVVDRASGAYLWDKDGNRYIDILNGFGAILYGHSPAFILDAVHKQLDIGFPVGPQTELAGECAALLREMTGMERFTFCNTGSEAVMNGMRVARTVTGRNLIAIFTGDYHGSFDEVLVKAAGAKSMPVAPGIPRESVSNMLVLEYGAERSLEILRQRAGELAAVLVEPVQSRHPALRPAEFLREVRRVTAESGSALMFDEVVTGFRTHPGGMQAVFGIRADLATYGKVVAGGLPIGVLAGSAAYMDALDGGQWRYGDDSFPEVGVTFCAGTFVRHPLAMAAVKASLEHLKASGPALQEALSTKTSALVADLQSMFQEFGYPAALEGYASWFYFSVPPEPKLARLLHFHLREKGIHIQEGFPCFLTTAHSDADLDTIRNAFRDSLREMQAGHALDSPSGHRNSEPAAEDREPAVPSVAAPPIEDPEIREFPITEPQREILLATQLGEEANCAFNESTSLRLTGKLEELALIQALATLVARHDALRSAMGSDGEIVRVTRELALPLQKDDLSGIPEAERQARLSQVVRAEASTPFDLTGGPLFRVRLVSLAPEEHVLVFTAHHIVFDGWSTNVLYSELSRLYNSAVSGRSSELPAPLGFGRYASDQKAREQSPERATTESYWLEQFRSIPAPLELPLDRPRPALRGNRGATRQFVVPGELAQAVRKAGARQGSTLFATLLAAYALLLQKLSQQGEVVIGIPMAGQSQVESGSTLVGHCVNFLPIRSSYDPEQTLSKFLQQTRKTLLDAQDHQDSTYGSLLRKLKIERDPSRLQLVEVQFNLEQLGAGLEFANLAAHLEANPKTSVNMDLFFNFVDRGGELGLDVDYNADLLDASTIDRWFEHMLAILAAIASDGGRRLADLSLLTPAQRETILTAWNQTDADFSREGSIHRAFELQARLTPDAIAVSAERSLTYAELNDKANQLARFLDRAGVKPGERVGVCIERSLEAIAGLLAILKSGAAYVPIDPTYPAGRLAYMIGDAGVRILLAQRSTAEALPALAATVIRLDEEWPAIALESASNLANPGGPEAEAYVMYTSGSTGNPKGVLVPHRAVLRLVKNNTFAGFSPEEVFLQLAPLSFDASTLEIWGPLLNGGRLALAPAGRITPEEIGRTIESQGVTTVWLTAALFHLMVNEHINSLRPLRQLLAGGDVLSPAHVRRALEALPGLRLINGYGPTENTTFTCCHTIALEDVASGSVPIGRPIANTRVYLLDSAKKPVPPGVAGELFAAGPGLALGYLNSPELNAQKFLEHAFENGRKERLYRTGDLARYRPDGSIEFLGRADTQVKVRGYRIELAEIEHALERSPLVRSAVAAVRTDWVTKDDTPGDKRLAVYVVPASSGDETSTMQELRRFLKEQLPEYMQPAAIVLLQSLPRTLNGKVDRRALPAPQAEEALLRRPVVYPRNPAEEELARIWSKVLGVPEIGVETSIFELGGDSLLIFRITTMARQAGLPLTARHIFEYRTVASICAHLEKSPAASGRPAEAIEAQPRARYRRPQTTLQ